jgi:hypothetical protein
MTDHLTTSAGAPRGDNQHSLTAGERGGTTARASRRCCS